MVGLLLFVRVILPFSPSRSLPGITIPEDIKFFSDNAPVEVARSIVADWDFFQTILSKDDPTGGVKGLHVPLVFSLPQSTRFRLCFTDVCLPMANSDLFWSPFFTFSIPGVRFPHLRIQLS